jgi:apolipoprotein N-acyltransferase
MLTLLSHICQDFFGVFWFVVGNWWIFTSETCAVDSPELYYTSAAFLLLGYIQLMSVALRFCPSRVERCDAY